MWLDSCEFKYIQEVGIMNIFFVIDGIVVILKLDGGILFGIIWDMIFKLLFEYGYKVEECFIVIDELVDVYKVGKLQEVFGFGIVVVVVYVLKVVYDGFEMEFLLVEECKVGLFIKV